MKVRRSLVGGAVLGATLIAASVALGDGSSGLSTSTTAAPPADTAALQAEVNHQLAITHGGAQVAPNVVSYSNDTVRVVFPLPGQTHTTDPIGPGPALPSAGAARTTVLPAFDTHGCPWGYNTKWTCFYQNVNFGGRMLEFKDCDYYQYFGGYGFDNQTSSWVNTKDYATVGVYDDYSNFLWHENPQSESNWVGRANNDRASFFEIHSNGECNP